jgi:ABC-2 type transport system permease protein
MISMIRKEIEAYFTTPFGFVFMGIFLLLAGLTFTMSNLLGGNGDLLGMFGLLANISFMTFPILTMRQYSEERKAGTEQLLLRSRLSSTDIVLGKYIAALAVFLLTLLLTAVFPIILVIYGDPNIGGIFASYFGFFLFGSAMIAVCSFIASFTENQVIAAIASFGLLFLLVMLASFSKSIEVPVLKQILSALAISARYDEFIRGVFRPGPVSYYICYAAVFLFLTVTNIKRRQLA